MYSGEDLAVRQEEAVRAIQVTVCSGEAAARAIAVKIRRILLVEDHDDTVRVMARLLRAHEYEVETACDVASARRIAPNFAFDLLVSDLGLPDGSGLELMQELRQRRPILAIAVSGFGMQEDRARSKAAGFAEHLTKPISFQTLINTIQRLESSAL